MYILSGHLRVPPSNSFGGLQTGVLSGERGRGRGRGAIPVETATERAGVIGKRAEVTIQTPTDPLAQEG
ncbi:hypothetical protein SUGI_0505240 [Cryptomeria japonica]|nr:hypothetical protein SUGI_0505240 [Cryptomeria japonica]